MTLQQLLYTVKIAETKSMNRAAAELFISQPALSSAIKDLEDELQIEIFIRNQRGIIVTTEGENLLSYARQIVEMSEMLKERYSSGENLDNKFSVSMQHYSFAVEAFMTLAEEFKLNDYELAVHETKTAELIENVEKFRSEIGVISRNDFNEKALNKILIDKELEFVPLFQCDVYVYMSAEHPLAQKKKIAFDELADYPCLSFEQGENNSFYYAEEMFPTHKYKRIIKADDRATMLNLMTGMNGFTLCSGIICEKLNGDGYVAIPLDSQDKMTIGYIKKKKMPLSILGEKYISILKQYGNN
ncbi:MAG: LysR family transcriptional regulator [Clostridium sp.]|nr:LysR family transcriptional regulator [Clostridium sp.]MCM1460607.1 LysR family transcriptional regulator [Bacteroides sp.]